MIQISIYFVFNDREKLREDRPVYQIPEGKKIREECSLTSVVLRFSAFYRPTNGHARLRRETEVREELGPRRALVYPVAKHKYLLTSVHGILARRSNKRNP